MIRTKPEEGYDLIAIEGFACLHICSECDGIREKKGHDPRCCWDKKKEDKDE